MSRTAIAERPATEQVAPPTPTTEQDELAAIAKASRKRVHPPDVIAYARKHSDGALHRHFTWDDGKAADAHRLWQARQVIAHFYIVSRLERKPVRMFLSLKTDRRTDGGYRHVDDVLANDERRAEWRDMAIDDFVQLTEKYAALTELRPIFLAVKRAVKQYED
jgi:hypothetical protein